MKKLFYLCLFLLLVGCTNKPATNNSLNIKSDTLIDQKDNNFMIFCDKIPDIILPENMTIIKFLPLSYEYSTEMSSYDLTQELGEPLGKINKNTFVVVFFLAPVSGKSILVQTFSKSGDKISNQNLLGTEGIDDLNGTLKRFESSGLKMDKDLNMYCFYKDSYLKESSKDTVIKSFKEQYFKIDSHGKINKIK
jgi:hypothetical protein